VICKSQKFTEIYRSKPDIHRNSQKFTEIHRRNPEFKKFTEIFCEFEFTEISEKLDLAFKTGLATVLPDMKMKQKCVGQLSI